MSGLVRCLYISQAKDQFTAGTLEALARKSATNNARRNVSGMLLYSAGHFMQCLEGEFLDVAEVFKTVSADSRHGGVITLMYEPAAERQFGLWAMGALNLDVHGGELDRARLHRTLATARQSDSQRSARAAVTLLKDFRAQLPAAALKAA